mgnify:CR=1 FL=1
MLKSQCKTLAKPRENLFSDSLAVRNGTAQRFQRTNMVLHKKKAVSYIYLHIEIQNFFSTVCIFHNLRSAATRKRHKYVIIIKNEEVKSC